MKAQDLLFSRQSMSLRCTLEPFQNEDAAACLEPASSPVSLTICFPMHCAGALLRHGECCPRCAEIVQLRIMPGTCDRCFVASRDAIFLYASGDCRFDASKSSAVSKITACHERAYRVRAAHTRLSGRLFAAFDRETQCICSGFGAAAFYYICK